jgi:protease I
MEKSSYGVLSARTVSAVLFLALAAASWPQAVQKKAPPKVAMIIPFSQYDIDELAIPRGIFEKDGIQVTIASSQAGTARMGDHETKVDIVLKRLKVADYDAIIFVGGYGTPEYFDDPTANAIAKAAVKQKKILAAICWAPVILGKAGVLKGKGFTCSTDENLILNAGGFFATGQVVVDGDIITANGPSAAEEFGKTILARLKE